MSDEELKDFYFSCVFESAKLIVAESLNLFLYKGYVPKLKEFAICEQEKITFLEQICKERGVELSDY